MRATLEFGFEMYYQGHMEIIRSYPKTFCEFGKCSKNRLIIMLYTI